VPKNCRVTEGLIFGIGKCTEILRVEFPMEEWGVDFPKKEFSSKGKVPRVNLPR